MTLDHRARTVCLALAAAALISGCDGVSSTSSAITTSPRASGGSTSGAITSPPANCSNPSNAFGAVCWIDGTGGTVGTNTAPGRGDPISKGDPITTTSSGGIGFWVSLKIKYCSILGNSKLTVWPAGTTPQALIQFLTGSVVCSTLHHPGPEYLTAGHARITMTDPVFAVLINAGAVTIQVLAGSPLTVSTDTGEGPVTVHAGEQVTVSAAGSIGPAGKLVIQSKQEQAAILRVQR